jgi:PAT family beta-lactamase induction signal transducer AmpG
MNTAAPPSARTLPALSEIRWLRFASFTAFYIAQGFPIGLFSIALPAWLMAEGISPARVAGFAAVSGLPWTFKLIAAPMMDRYAFPAMGRRRPWVLGAQLGMVLAATQLLLINDADAQLTLLTAIAFVVNAFAATQDVAVDGMAIDVLPTAEQGRANAFMMGGQVLGVSISGAAGATLLVQGGVPYAAVLLMGLVATVTTLVLLVRERPGERVLPWTRGTATPRPDLPPMAEWGKILRNLMRVLFVPMSLLLIVAELIYRSASGIGVVLYPKIAVNMLGYGSAEFSQWLAITGAVSAVLGLGVGLLIDRFTAARMLVAGLLTSSVLYLCIGLGHGAWATPGLAPAVMVCIDLVGQWIFVSTIALFMGVCAPSVAATQFAVYMAIANFSRTLGSAMFPSIEAVVDTHQMFYVLSAIVFTAALIVSRFDPRGMKRDAA